jgi:hypothetical protein
MVQAGLATGDFTLIKDIRSVPPALKLVCDAYDEPRGNAPLYDPADVAFKRGQ